MMVKGIIVSTIMITTLIVYAGVINNESKATSPLTTQS
jgi:hypothetical protein